MSMASGKVGKVENVLTRLFVAGTGTAKNSYTITIPNGSSHYLMINSNATGNNALIYVGATSTGVIGRRDIDILGVSFTNGTGSITLTITTTQGGTPEKRPIYILDNKIRGDWISVS